MEYISTKELSEMWNVSISRIVRLAKEGRIPGAKLVGKSWVFPPDTEKPRDRRKKENNIELKKPRFRFPFYHYYPYTEEEIANDFTNEERALYNAECMFFACKFEECRTALNDILATMQDPYVRFGSMYYLCLINTFLRDYSHACLMYHELNCIYSNETAHKKELEFIMHDLETYFTGNYYYLEEFNIDPEYPFPPEMSAYLLLESAYADMLQAAVNGKYVNVSPYELALKSSSRFMSTISAQMLHAYLSVIYTVYGRKQYIPMHMNEIARIAKHNNTGHMLWYLYQYVPDLFDIALRDQDPELIERVRSVSDSFLQAFHELLDFIGKKDFHQVLSVKEYRLVLCAAKGHTLKQIADMLGCSPATVSKRFSELYAKTGTHNRTELVNLYMNAFKDY